MNYVQARQLALTGHSTIFFSLKSIITRRVRVPGESPAQLGSHQSRVAHFVTAQIIFQLSAAARPTTKLATALPLLLATNTLALLSMHFYGTFWKIHDSNNSFLLVSFFSDRLKKIYKNSLLRHEHWFMKKDSIYKLEKNWLQDYLTSCAIKIIIGA